MNKTHRLFGLNSIRCSNHQELQRAFRYQNLVFSDR